MKYSHRMLTAAGIAIFLALGSVPSRAGSAATEDDEAHALKYWRVAREELFAGIDLSTAQHGRIDAILASAAADRTRSREIQDQLKRTRAQGDDEHFDALVEQLKQVQANFAPSERVDAIRAVLTQDQLEAFDSNRRLRQDRLVAEARKQGSRQQRQRPNAGR